MVCETYGSQEYGISKILLGPEIQLPISDDAVLVRLPYLNVHLFLAQLSDMQDYFLSQENNAEKQVDYYLICIIWHFSFNKKAHYFTAL